MLTALPSLRRDIARPLFVYGAHIWRTILDGIEYRHPDHSLRLAGDCHSEHRDALLDLYRDCPALRLCRRQLCLQHGQHQLLLPKAKQGSALGINGGLGNLGVSVMQLVAPLVIFLPMFTFRAWRAYRRMTVPPCGWPMRPGSGRRCYCWPPLRPSLE